jgi:AAA domain
MSVTTSTATNAKDLQQELRKAPIYSRPTPYAAGGDRNSFNLQSLRDCFDAPEELQQWLVDGILPTGGMSVMSAKPKVGKSTVARQLALSIATGKPFLGRETQQGEVIYFALEEKRQEVTNHFRDLGATGDEPIRIHCGSAPLDAMEEARVLIQQQCPALLVIDPLFKFTRVKDGNDYAQMTAALEPILALARETGTHILNVHHSGKGERADPTDAILGSTAIFGNVDTALMLAKYDVYRTISSCQRYGEDLPETVLEFDSQRRAVILGASRDQADQNRREQQILKFLESRPGAVEADILAGVTGRKQNKVSDLRNLVGTRIKREGKGGKKDPYRYSLSSWSQVSDTVSGTTTRKTSETIVPRVKVVVPKTGGTTGNKNRAPTSTDDSRRPSPAVKEIREGSRGADPDRFKPAGKSENKKPIKIESADDGSPLSRTTRKPARRYPDANRPWSPFEEQVAILEVEGGLSRADAVRSVKKTMRD